MSSSHGRNVARTAVKVGAGVLGVLIWALIVATAVFDWGGSVRFTGPAAVVVLIVLLTACGGCCIFAGWVVRDIVRERRHNRW